MSNRTIGRAAAAPLAAALVLAGCRQSAPPKPPPPEVQVITVAAQPTANVIELPGRLHAIRIADVRARVDGIVEHRLYTEGTDVRAGQPLFQIDPRQLRAQLNAAEAALARAEATAANAAQDVARYKGLVAQQALSQQEYDAAVARQRTAQADVAQMQAQIANARLSLSYTTVTAPISGRAGRAEVTEGALVSAGGATLLTRIEQIDPIYANFSQSSSDVLKLRAQLNAGSVRAPALRRVPVNLVLEDGSSYSHEGHLDFFDLSIDEATGTAALRAEFPNPERSPLPGQFVRARIEAGVRSDAILLPQRAVTVTPQGANIMVVGANDIVEARPVKVGALAGGSWTILDGLKAGERVIVDGLQKAQPGQPPARRSSPRSCSPALSATPRPLVNLVGPDGLTWSFGSSLSLPIFNRGRLRGNSTVLPPARELRGRRLRADDPGGVPGSVECARRATLSRRAGGGAGARPPRPAPDCRAGHDTLSRGVGHIEVLDAERNLFAAEHALLQRRREEADNLVALYIALGGGVLERR